MTIVAGIVDSKSIARLAAEDHVDGWPDRIHRPFSDWCGLPVFGAVFSHYLRGKTMNCSLHTSYRKCGVKYGVNRGRERPHAGGLPLSLVAPALDCWVT
jgi:hypothetical protein